MKVKLRDVSNIIMGQSPDSSTYNTEKIGLPFFQGNADFGELNPIAKTWCSAPIKIAYKNYILISVRAPIGALNIAAETCCIGRGLAAFDVNNKMCTQKYLWYLLKAKKNELLSKGTGSTFKAISKNILSEMEFNIPPVREQELCTKVLDVVFCLIRLKKEQLDKLDLLVKSRFIELFGDPNINQKGFPLYTIDDVMKFQGGSQPDKKYFEYEPTEDNIRLIQIRDYRTDNYKTYIPKAMAKRFCNKDDIMIGRYGPPIFQILGGLEGSFNVALMKVIPKMGNTVFLRYFLKQECLLKYLESMSQRTAGQDGIQMDKLKAYPFPYPPEDIQDKFAAFVAQVDKSKFVVTAKFQ